MRKLYIVILFFQIGLTVSQETTHKDALRFGTDELNGTARFRALSGAFGAVGGDLSAININPAGSLFFNYNTASVTLSNYHKKNNASYFGTNTSDRDNSFELNQVGVAFVYENSGSGDWDKLALSFNYDNISNFDNQLFSRGLNPSQSISNYFLGFAQGTPLEFLQTQTGESISQLYTYLGETPGLGFPVQQAMLGYQAYLYDAANPNNLQNTSYLSNVPSGTFLQENSIATSGYHGKLTGNFAASYKDKILLGMNLNAHFVDINKNSAVYEQNSNDVTLGVQNILFENFLYTYGAGFSFNLGAIIKANEFFRFGVSYESPTWLRLNDELTQRLSARSTDGANVFTDIVDPNVTNIYDSYTVKTPGKWTFSGVALIQKRGLISVDVSTRDHSNTTFSPKNNALYNGLNQEMSTHLKSALSYNIGGEYKIGKVSLRGGYRFEESPYKIDYTLGDLSGYSAGLGYSFGSSRLDASFAQFHRNYNQELVSSGMNDFARIQNRNTNISLTYTIIF